MLIQLEAILRKTKSTTNLQFEKFNFSYLLNLCLFQEYVVFVIVLANI